MDVFVSSGAIQSVVADAIVVNLFEGVTQPGGATGAVDHALNGAVRDLIAMGELTGRLNETCVFHPRGVIPAHRLIVVGLGKQTEFSLDAARQAAAAAARAARKAGARTLASVAHGAGLGGLPAADAAQAVVEGTLLGLYRYAAPRSRPTPETDRYVESLTLVEFDAANLPAVESGARIGRSIAEAICFARNLSNQPSNIVTPTALAEMAQRIAADHGMTCQVLGSDEIGALGMGALLGVSLGASQPPRFIVLEHTARGEATGRPYVLVGKGITFDSGGISIKPWQGMEVMRGDMAGAAAVLAAMQAAGNLGLRRHVIALIPATENMPDGNAMRPGDVVKALNGVSIEVVDTDAEGRLVLADALAYAQRYSPLAVVDVATLTGAVTVALGCRTTGAYVNDDNLWQALHSAATAAGEPLWRMPLDPTYDRQLETPFADVKNYGGSAAGSVMGARFLSHFIGEHAWAHLDIAGTDWWENDLPYPDKPYFVRGSTGVGVGTLVGLLRHGAD